MDAATSRTASTAAYFASTRSRGGGSGSASGIVAEIAVAKCRSTTLLLDTCAFGLDGVIDVGGAAETVGSGLVDNFEIEKDEDASVLDRVACILRDTNETVLFELAGFDHGALLRGKHSLSVVKAIRENDAVSVADVGSGGSTGLDLFDAEDLANRVLNRVSGVGCLYHLGDGALGKVVERHLGGVIFAIQSRVQLQGASGIRGTISRRRTVLDSWLTAIPWSGLMMR